MSEYNDIRVAWCSWNMLLSYKSELNLCHKAMLAKYVL